MLLINSDDTILSQPMVATIGFFDGVHVGHRYLIDQVKAIAQKRGLPSAVITFTVHPRKVMQTDYQPALLCGYEEKIKRLSETGIDYCISLDFTMDMSRMDAFEFMRNVLKERLHVETLVIGYDHRFGHDRKYDFHDYMRFGYEIGIHVVQAKEWDGGEHVSSSRIRRLLGEGNIKKAAQLLTYNYTISGKIVEGFKVGRTIGFPTANIQVWETFKVIPAFGVYAVYVHVCGQRYGGMLYIGKRPTLQNGEQISIEVNLFGFDDDLYNKELTAEFIEFVRPDAKFPDIASLKRQIQDDKETVIALLERYNKLQQS